jgi:hypothetical protein
VALFYNRSHKCLFVRPEDEAGTCCVNVLISADVLDFLAIYRLTIKQIDTSNVNKTVNIVDTNLHISVKGR